MQKPYIQHEGKVVDTDEQFKYVMAITLNPHMDYKEGALRCIVSRSGDLTWKGNIDRSELHKIKGDSLEKFEIGEKLEIKNEKEIIGGLTPEGWDFIGLEDPDIWIDNVSGMMHLYFTIPILPPKDYEEKIKVHLGHAVGKDLDTLEMTAPVLLDNGISRAKEVSIAPLNSQGFRFNLIESKDRVDGVSYSVVQVATARDMGKDWEYGEIAFHPKDKNIPWIAGHASPGPLFSKKFIDIGEWKLLGLMNGCEANQKVDDKIKYGDFSIGLFIYDYENGRIDWVSPEPFIQDTEASEKRAITFASQFVETKPGEGILYAHVDDSFVRAYTLNAEGIKELLPK